MEDPRTSYIRGTAELCLGTEPALFEALLADPAAATRLETFINGGELPVMSWELSLCGALRAACPPLPRCGIAGPASRLPNPPPRCGRRRLHRAHRSATCHARAPHAERLQAPVCCSCACMSGRRWRERVPAAGAPPPSECRHWAKEEARGASSRTTRTLPSRMRAYDTPPTQRRPNTLSLPAAAGSARAALRVVHPRRRAQPTTKRLQIRTMGTSTSQTVVQPTAAVSRTAPRWAATRRSSQARRPTAAMRSNRPGSPTSWPQMGATWPTPAHVRMAPQALQRPRWRSLRQARRLRRRRRSWSCCCSWMPCPQASVAASEPAALAHDDSGAVAYCACAPRVQGMQLFPRCQSHPTAPTPPSCAGHSTASTAAWARCRWRAWMSSWRLAC